MYTPTHHAVERYIERFEDDLLPAEAWQRLVTISRNARFSRRKRGRAQLFTSGDIALIIANGFIVTVYQNLPDDLDFYALFAA